MTQNRTTHFFAGWFWAVGWRWDSLLEDRPLHGGESDEGQKFETTVRR